MVVGFVLLILALLFDGLLGVVRYDAFMLTLPDFFDCESSFSHSFLEVNAPHRSSFAACNSKIQSSLVCVC